VLSPRTDSSSLQEPYTSHLCSFLISQCTIRLQSFIRNWYIGS